jgi:hypothetical protein
MWLLHLMTERIFSEQEWYRWAGQDIAVRFTSLGRRCSMFLSPTLEVLPLHLKDAPIFQKTLHEASENASAIVQALAPGLEVRVKTADTRLPDTVMAAEQPETLDYMKFKEWMHRSSLDAEPALRVVLVRGTQVMNGRKPATGEFNVFKGFTYFAGGYCLVPVDEMEGYTGKLRNILRHELYHLLTLSPHHHDTLAPGEFGGDDDLLAHTSRQEAAYSVQHHNVRASTSCVMEKRLASVPVDYCNRCLQTSRNWRTDLPELANYMRQRHQLI